MIATENWRVMMKHLYNIRLEGNTLPGRLQELVNLIQLPIKSSMSSEALEPDAVDAEMCAADQSAADMDAMTAQNLFPAMDDEDTEIDDIEGDVVFDSMTCRCALCLLPDHRYQRK